MNTNKFSGILAGILIGSVLSGGAVLAKDAAENISVRYRNIKVYKDGVLAQLKNANGDTLEPFIYQGTTYLPVRGAAELAGMTVEWDGATNSIYLWDEQIPGGTYLMDVCPPYQWDNGRCKLYYPNSSKYFQMLGKQYSNGLVIESQHGDADFNLDGKYKTMTLTLGPIDGQSLDGGVAFVVDGKVIEEYYMEPGDRTQEVTIPLNYGLQMQIRGIDVGNGAYKNCSIGLANITVS